MSIHWSAIFALLTLVVTANGVPLLLAMVRGGRGRPLDGGRVWRDARPLLGPSKTWRGLFAALTATSALAWALGLGWSLGLAVALGAMAGDLLASFAKRRLGLASSASAPLLDQIPEALIPALLAGGKLGLGALETLLAVCAFTLLDLVLTPLLGAVRRRRD